MIPGLVGVSLLLAACGGEAPAPAADAPSVPVPALEDLPAPYNTADLARGKSLFGQKCDSCHTLPAGKSHLVGPNLHGLFDRGTAAARNYDYSDVLDRLEPDMWTPELIDRWLQSPQAFGKTNMFFEGIADESQRRDLIAFLLIESRK